MSGFLTRLAERALAASAPAADAPAPLVVPRRVSLFEPPAGGLGAEAAADIELREVTEEAEAPATRRVTSDAGAEGDVPQRREPADPSGPVPRPDVKRRGAVDRETVDPETVDPETVDPDLPEANEALRPRREAERIGTSQPPGEADPRDAAPARPPRRAERAAIEPPAEPQAKPALRTNAAEPGSRNRLESRAAALEQRNATAPRAALAKPASEPLGPLVARRPPPLPATPRAVEPRPGLGGRPRALAREIPPEPEVHVTIGRVDIRATHEPAPPRRAPARHGAAPALSLSDYLRRRETEGR